MKTKRNRSLTELKQIEDRARALYLETGGADIDEALAALRLTMQAYSAQMNAACHFGQQGIPYDPRITMQWGPNVSPHEARLTAARMWALIRQREQKMEHCRAVIAEGLEHTREQQAKQAKAEQEAAAPSQPKADAEPPKPEPVLPESQAKEPLPEIKPGNAKPKELALAG